MKFTTDGLIIRENNVGECDRVVTVLTREHGLIRAFANGARRMNNKNSSSTGLLCYSTLTFFKRKDTYTIDESAVKEVFFSLREDIEKLSIAQYFCEVLSRIVPEDEAEEEYLRLILNSLFFLSKEKCDIYKIKAIFELRLMCLAGFMPDLVACADCSSFESDRMWFDVQNAVLFCENCKRGTGIFEIDRAVVTAMRYIVYSPFNKIFSFDLPEADSKRLSDITELFLLTQTDLKFIALNFFHTLGL